jgi:hypothetical protein
VAKRATTYKEANIHHDEKNEPLHMTTNTTASSPWRELNEYLHLLPTISLTSLLESSYSTVYIFATFFVEAKSPATYCLYNER